MKACIAAILDNWTHMRQSLTLREGKTNGESLFALKRFIVVRDGIMSKNN